MIDPISRAEWLERRRHGIGSSDAPIVTSVSPWGSRIELWEQKLGLAPDTEATFRMRLGLVIEPVIAQLVAEQMDWPDLRRHPMRVHRRWPWMLASVDRIRKRRIVELKSSAFGFGYGEDGDPDGIPPHVRVQVQHQLEVLRYDVAHVAVLVGLGELRMYDVEPDRELIEGLVEEEADYWGHVERGEPPEPDATDAYRAWLARRFPRDNGLELVATAEQIRWADELREAQAVAGDAQERVDELKNRIRVAMGEASALIGPGFRFSYTTNRETDWAALAAEIDPPADLVAAHTATDWRAVVKTLRPRPAVVERFRTPTGNRVLRPKFEEGAA